MKEDKLAKLKRAGFKLLSSEEVCTNNSWGFGGRLGADHTFEEGFVYKTGRLYFRRGPSEPIDRICLPGLYKPVNFDYFLKLAASGMKVSEMPEYLLKRFGV